MAHGLISLATLHGCTSVAQPLEASDRAMPGLQCHASAGDQPMLLLPSC